MDFNVHVCLSKSLILNGYRRHLQQSSLGQPTPKIELFEHCLTHSGTATASAPAGSQAQCSAWWWRVSAAPWSIP